MNTSALKAFAPSVRRQLIEAVTRKLDFVLSARTPDYLTTFAAQVAALRTLAEEDRNGLIERVAYTWFNRFTALRYLDARGWHPFRARVLTPFSPEETQPEVLKLTRTGSLPDELRRHTDPDRLNDLLDGRIPTAIPNADPQGEVYRHLVLAACRFYYALLPDLFEKLDDETELLLPDDLLTEHSVLQGFRTEITDEDCAEVELIGWLYQFYIAEKKDAVMARKSAVPTEDIPAVTQLFTPHWIVRYLVENSLGRLWLLNRPGSRLREQMPYYIEGEAETEFLRITKPEEIRVLDPAVGSGHMLTYAFDLLFAIYEEEGYAPSDIAGLILTHNLYGVDICPRAAQLAFLALVLKAREKSRRFFQSDELVRPHILELRDLSFAENELRDYIRALGLGDLFNQPMLKLLHQFEEAKTFGSLIQPCLDEQSIAFAREAVELKSLGDELFLRETHERVLRVLTQAKMLSRRYQVVVANPPYLGRKAMSGLFTTFAKQHYPDSKSDLFAAFIERGFSLAVPRAYSAMVTMQSWMFLSSYEALRFKILREKSILSMVHMGNNVMGIAFGTAATVWTNQPRLGHRGLYCYVGNEDIGDGNRPAQFPPPNARNLSSKRAELLFSVSAEDLKKIPGSPIAYWIKDETRSAFLRATIGDKAVLFQGIITGNNEKFVRQWWELPLSEIHLNATSIDDIEPKSRQWVPYNKGGESIRWYGNQDLVVNFSARGRDFTRGKHQFYEYFFKPCFSWTYLSATSLATRFFPGGFIWDVAGSSAFPADEEDIFYFMSLIGSIVGRYLLGIINPTINFQVENIAAVPVIYRTNEQKVIIVSLAKECIRMAAHDWNQREASWNFSVHCLLMAETKGATLGESWRNWEAQSTAAIRQMKELETKNNRLFIDAYCLQDELCPEVPEDHITLAHADAQKDMAAFLSYALGCMMGRYSLDKPGLILADAGDTLSNYFTKVGKPLDQLTFVPDEDGIIPVLDGEWFEDDIVARTREFLRSTFGETTLRENIRFIEESLGKDLRKYFLSDFYKNHISNERAHGYKKRPVYWLVQSPRKGFSVLIYLHRYTRDTMNLVLNRYLRPYQEKLRNRLAHLSQVQANDGVSARDKTAARKEADKLTKILHECEEWERQTLLPLAQARIELDLDDGVKVNYQKLGEALAPIAGLASTED
jgi:hypothetical protein